MSTVATEQHTTGKGSSSTWHTPAELQEANPRRPWRRKFLAQLRQHGSATEAARHAGVSLTYVYRCRKRSKEFDSRWADALATARKRKVDQAESRLKHLAVDGYDDPVYQGGVLVGTRRRYSVDALKTLLGAEHPRKYARKPSVTQPTSIAITIDARQAFLRDPVAMALACELDERLAITHVADDTRHETQQPATQPATIDVSDASVVTSHVAPVQPVTSTTVQASNRAPAPGTSPPPARPMQPRKLATPQDAIIDSAWADEPWDDDATDVAPTHPSRGA